MLITLNEIASNKTTRVSVNGEVLTVDGVEFDLSIIPDGGQVEAELPAIGLIKRVNGVIEITIEYHYDATLAEPMQSTIKEDYIIDCTNGEIPSPIQWIQNSEIEEKVYAENDPMSAMLEEVELNV